ncbi:sodium:proton exchanger [Pseudomonas sp. HMWF032]|uniref:cation:proton antiporter n=1 Tax=unclassified Pseudomonas TaxID=196821 RepID=UPI000D339026|nr:MULTISPECIES: cation:proton antiporter family protein [unclassified Pseudomonas]PTS85323.1 sodium:proton exchanger [Pseudomonas sp. HMWF032]PTT84787.1 sodium:proton exchanger [Pseudomonas sp. HMWF010]WAC42979.1 cation:proton antiporter [Pseudomonas sp. SL4(2022)]
MNLFQEVAILLALSAVVGGIAVKLRQPLIIAYILVGILAGPAVLGLSSENEPLQLLAEIGITVLLFVVGLKLDMRLVRTLGPVALATGLGQLSFTIVFGFILCYLLGLEWLTALYVAVALTFSSTIIIVKLLSDKGEIDSLHGRIAMGFLIVQDIAVVLAMLGLNLYQPGTAEQPAMSPWLLSLTLLGSLAVLFLLMRYALPRLLNMMADSPELLMLMAIAWGTLLAAGADSLGLSKEIGAFLAGFSLASTSLREAVASRLTSLRDFLLLFFFLHLGLQLDFAYIHGQVGSALILSAFVLIGNPLIVMAIMGWMGYRKRTGFMAGLTVAQISEFSIIFVAMGIGLGHIGQPALGLTTLVGLITITLSTYMILYAQPLFVRFSPWLGVFERAIAHRENADDTAAPGDQPDIIVYGMGRYGRNLASQLQQGGRRVLGVDFDPQALAQAREEGLTVCYGDAEDADFLSHMPLSHAQALISTIPQREVNAILLRALRSAAFKGQITLSAFRAGDAEALHHAGAASVLRPYSDAAETAARRLLAEIRQR